MVILPSQKLALVIEYDGTRYYGFQIQTGVPTIQGEIETALAKITGEGIRIVGAGRTDAGVHAKGQVVSFFSSSNFSPMTIIKALNFHLPKDIAVKRGEVVKNHFNAKRNAISRQYRYKVINSPTRSPLVRNYAYHIITPLDHSKMNEACQIIIGRHDFASFTSPLEESTIRTVSEARVFKENGLIVFDITANSFLPKQVRSIIGCLIRIGTGKMSINQFKEILLAKKSNLAAPVMPAFGLCLTKVNYLEYDFSKGTD